MDELATKLMPPDTKAQANDLIQTTVEPGIFRITRELNSSFVIVECLVWVSKKVNGKYKKVREKTETYIPRGTITEIRRPISG